MPRDVATRPSALRLWLLQTFLLITLTALPPLALAVDTDGDTCDDLVDAFPYDNTRCAGNTGILATFNGDSEYDNFGRSVSTAGDVNNDGYADVIVGAYYDDRNGSETDTGSARIVSGASGSILYTFYGDGREDYFGLSVSAAGDVNNDGFDDVIVGAYMDDNNGSESGSALVFSGATGAILYTFNGDSASDQFGYSVSGAGDVNNDGFADVIVGTHRDDNNGTDSGSARVFSGANGSILYTFNGDSSNDQLGYSVSDAGDVNNDGFDDVIVGAHGETASGPYTGSAKVYSGSNGAILYTFNGESASDYFGYSVSAAGDVDNDGFSDVIVGAYKDDNNGTDSGSAQVFSGANGTLLYTFNGDGVGDYFGLSVSAAGDVNNDGFDDVIVGAFGDDNNGGDSGSARVLSGANGSILYTFNGDSAGDKFGYSVSAAGDVNNDGFDDVIVGASVDDNNGANSGSARVFSGKASLADFDNDGTNDSVDADDDNDGALDINDPQPRNSAVSMDPDFDGIDSVTDNCPTVANASQLNNDGDSQGDACDTDDDNDSVLDTTDSYPFDASRSAADTGILATFYGDSAYDYFGYSVSTAGDVNADGYADVIVGAYGDYSNGSDSGSVRVLSGATGAILYAFSGDSAGDRLGYSVSAAGDVNNDGFADVIVGAYGDDNNGSESGTARVYSGANGAILYAFNGDSAGDRFGHFVSAAGDVNADGYADVIVGAHGDDNNGDGSGSARVFSGINGVILYTFNGDSISDQFGISVSAAGDVNNDGFDDVIVGANRDDNNGSDSGSARVFSGATGAILYTFNGDSALDFFGHSVSTAGDVNNDGYADVIVGAPYDDNNGSDSGSARVFSGINGAIIYTFNGDSAGDFFGNSVSAAGDVNNDGFDDVIVGAVGDDKNGLDSGSAHVFSGGTGAILYTFIGDSAGDRLGHSVGAAGDVNNDTYDDVIVGAFWDGNYGSYSGSARVFNGNALSNDFDSDGTNDSVDADDDNDGALDVNDPRPQNPAVLGDPDRDGIDSITDNCPTASNADQLNTDGDTQGDACDTDDDNDGVLDTADSYPFDSSRSAGATGILATFNGDSAGDNFGTSVSSAGDVNNDGVADVIVGAPYDDNNGADSGSARVFSGANGAILYTFNGDSVNNFFGCSVSAAGDINNDGFDDVIVGAYGVSTFGGNNGAARVFSGANGGILYTFSGDSPQDQLGYSVSGAGDVNNDGYADVIVGARYDANNGLDSGSARIYSGATGSMLYIFNGDTAGDRLGHSVSEAGDVNNDGYADVIVGAPYDDNTGASSGSARVLSGANGTILYTFNGDKTEDQFGYSVSAAGDVNADGYADIIVGSYQYYGAYSGSARVLSGANGAILYNFTGDTIGDYFGNSVSAAGDVNNDSFDDVIVGAYWDDNNGDGSGSARVLSGATGAILYVFNGDSASDQFGYSVSAAGDVNNDGFADLIAGAYTDDNTGTNAGSARIFSGRASVANWDADGSSDALDTDDDNDGTLDINDATPIGNRVDTDVDGTGDVFDTDDDNDTVLDGSDNCPLLANTNQLNTDGDAQGNVCDSDDDGDGVADSTDVFPLDGTETLDNDNDGTGNTADTDDDNDTRVDTSDNCPLLANTDQLNTDGDAQGNVCDSDDDNDTVSDSNDNCPLTANASQQDSDGDGLGNVCDSSAYPVSGGLNGDFNPGLGANNTVWTTAEQADGKILIGGELTTYGGVSRKGIARINSNGSLDTGFTVGSGITGDYINALLVQPDGRIVIGGLFSHYNGVVRNNVARLNSNGTLDTTFSPAGGVNGPVYAVAQQADGKILIGGEFTTVGGYSYDRLARLNSNGTVDTTFTNPNIQPVWVGSIAVQPDNKVVIAGAFQTVNGVRSPSLARLNSNGTRDTAFAVGEGFNEALYTVALQADGKVLVGGGFSLYNNAAANRVARLNSDATLDTTFNQGTGVDGWFVYTLAARNNSIVIGGVFTAYNGVARNHVARLNNDGSLDTGFNQGAGADNAVYASAIRADGDVVIGGAFTAYNGITRNRVAVIVAYSDNDNDGIDNGADPDDDNDGALDNVDNCYGTVNADQLNTDGDLQGNACDSDDDNDGVVDTSDAFPLNASETLDTDLDGTGNNADPDDDNDGLPDAMDPLPLQVKFNLNAPYKGSRMSDGNALQ